MTVLLDTSVLLTAYLGKERRHDDATRLLMTIGTGSEGRVVLCDHVVVEALNFLNGRFGRRDVAEDIGALYFGARSETGWDRLHTSPGTLDQAYALHLRYHDQRLSLTDCVLIAHAQNLNAKVATFDTAFDGIIPIVDA
ncbi:MAG: PIN domain-containing protein [Euryarchaeota archaeon]|nr:PIN domain-containing protein [Euryarchaeota archaeon]